MVNLGDEEENNNQSEKQKKKRTRHLSDHINHNSDWTQTKKDVRRWWTMHTVNHLEMGDEEMVEYHEATSKEFSEYIDHYEKEAAKGSKESHKIIDSSNVLMHFWRA